MGGVSKSNVSFEGQMMKIDMVWSVVFSFSRALPDPHCRNSYERNVCIYKTCMREGQELSEILASSSRGILVCVFM